MVTTVDSCMGVCAYAGVAFSYHEHITTGLKRLDDQDWVKHFAPSEAPEDVSWMRDLIVK